VTRDPAGAHIPRDPNLPRAIEIRVPGRTIRHAIDWNALPTPELSTPHALASMYATAMLNLEVSLTEAAILEGHDRIEVQVEGRPTVVKSVPSWWTETRKRIRVEWARRQHRRRQAAAVLA
jgi:hypothetical protein